MATSSKVTLRDLVQVVSDYATSDVEIVATVAYLINSGKVLLCGNFAGARIDLSVPTGAAPPSATTHYSYTRLKTALGLTDSKAT